MTGDVTGSVFEGNQANVGGGAYFENLVGAFAGNTLTSNTATGSDAAQGGGLYLYYASRNGNPFQRVHRQ